MLAERYLGIAFFGVAGQTEVSFGRKDILIRFFEGDGMTWFLISLFITKTLFDLLNRIIPSKLLNIIIGIILFVISFWSINIELNIPLWYFKFYLCYEIGWYYSNGIEMNKWRKVLLFACFIIIYFIALKNGRINILEQVLAGLVIYFIIIDTNIPRCNIIEYVGKNSMILYLVHYLCHFSLMILLSKLFTSFYIIMILYFVITFLVYYCVQVANNHIGIVHYVFYPYSLYNDIKNKMISSRE